VKVFLSPASAAADALTLPDFLSVSEAARVLRVSRNSAYKLANLFIDSDGAEGIPAVRFGRSIRIPRIAIEAILGGRVSLPEFDERKASPEQATPVGRSRRKRTTRPRSGGNPSLAPDTSQTVFTQQSLPFED
jgi:excisionase family DNA binding protein